MPASFLRGCEVPGVLCADPAGPEDGIWRGYPSRALPSTREEEGKEVHHVLRRKHCYNTTITMNNNHYFSERMREKTSERECALLRLLSLYWCFFKAILVTKPIFNLIFLPLLNRFIGSLWKTWLSTYFILIELHQVAMRADWGFHYLSSYYNISSFSAMLAWINAVLTS